MFSTNFMVWRNQLVSPTTPNLSDAISFLWSLSAQGATIWHGPLSHALTHSGYVDATKIYLLLGSSIPMDEAQVQNDLPDWLADHPNEPLLKARQVTGTSLTPSAQWLATVPGTDVDMRD